MSGRRTARVASVIREVVSSAILQELRDPRIRNVTVIGVDLTADLRYAKIRVSVMGAERDVSLTLHGLNSARGYLQSKVADRIRTRYTPELRFEIDRGVRKSAETSRILREVLSDESDSDLDRNVGGDATTAREFSADVDDRPIREDSDSAI